MLLLAMFWKHGNNRRQVFCHLSLFKCAGQSNRCQEVQLWQAIYFFIAPLCLTSQSGFMEECPTFRNLKVLGCLYILVASWDIHSVIYSNLPHLRIFWLIVTHTNNYGILLFWFFFFFSFILFFLYLFLFLICWDMFIAPILDYGDDDLSMDGVRH